MAPNGKSTSNQAYDVQYSFMISFGHDHHWLLSRAAFNHATAGVLWQPSTPIYSLVGINGCQLTLGKVSFRFAPY